MITRDKLYSCIVNVYIFFLCSQQYIFRGIPRQFPSGKCASRWVENHRFTGWYRFPCTIRGSLPFLTRFTDTRDRHAHTHTIHHLTTTDDDPLPLSGRSFCCFRFNSKVVFPRRRKSCYGSSNGSRVSRERFFSLLLLTWNFTPIHRSFSLVFFPPLWSEGWEEK